MPKPWRCKLWGVWFTSIQDPRGVLIGRGWVDRVSSMPPDDPIRCLLFTSRAVARRVAQSLTVQHIELKLGWKFRAVRVEEIVRMVK